MKKQLSNISSLEKIYLAMYPICILAFLLPASRVELGGQSINQYLLTGYAGRLAFFIIFLFGAIQWLVFYRKNKLFPWMGMIAGLYISSFAITMYPPSFTTFQTVAAKNLAVSLNAGASPLPGLFILAFSGAILFVLALIKILRKQ